MTPEYYQNYRIDLYLNRYDKALENIAKVDEKFDEAVQFIINHKLYSKALVVFQDQTSFHVFF